MALIFFNSLTHKKEEFIPLSSGKVGLYTCGPTVYDHAHIGNLRAYIFADILKRVLLSNNYEVNHIMNFTDVDDKTIKASQENGKSLREFTSLYTDLFLQDSDALSILRASKYTKATDYVKEMLVIIEELIAKGFAYKSEDGSIYFDVAKDKDYGKLVPIDRESLLENAKQRIKTDEYEKNNAQDFALWKSWNEEDGEVFWIPSQILSKDTIMGKGRPGWHIECSAMSMTNLGHTIDIHTGGLDNMFPHHENEIAQSECATGEKFTNYFMHNGWLLVDNKKMSKSLGNFYTLNNIKEKGYSPLVLKYFALQTHYRSPINFTWEHLDGAKVAYQKLVNFVKNTSDTGEVQISYLEEFKNAMNDDLNTPRSLGILWSMMNDINISSENKLATILEYDKILGLDLDKVKDEKLELSEEVLSLMKARDLARQDKDWKKSDELRNELKYLGYEVKDGDKGTEVYKI